MRNWRSWSQKTTNQAVQPTGASRLAQTAIERHRRLAPVADLHVGLRELQVQTNLAGAGLGANWSPVAGSTTNTQMSLPIDPAGPSVFYRLHQQQ